jgi:DNA-binding NarL/FixJ family response regulator
MAIRVLISESNHVFRIGLRNALENNEEIEVVDALENDEQLLTTLHFNVPDIVLMDIDEPSGYRWETLNEIATINKKVTNATRIIVISACNTDACIAEILEQGVNGFLCKATRPGEILKAIESVYHNGFYFNDKTSRALLKRIKKRSPGLPNTETNIPFTRTELEVLQLLCKEMTSAQIGKKLFISSRTVEDARHQLLKKTGAKNSVGLALWAARHELISY